MLIWFLVIFSIVAWVSVGVIYFRHELFRWLDNRFGPTRVERKPPRPQRRRMYD